MILRPMLMADADKMLELKNYPETRLFSIITKGEIQPDAHYRWLEKNIQFFQIIELTDKTVGAIRIQNNEVSIWIDKIYWGMGVATQILKRVAKEGMIAKIVNGNVGSFKAFVRAGFVPVAYLENYYVLLK